MIGFSEEDWTSSIAAAQVKGEGAVKHKVYTPSVTNSTIYEGLRNKNMYQL